MNVKKKSARLMQKFLLSYLLILIIPMLFCAYAYSKAVSTIGENASEYHLSMLNQAKNSLELRIQEAQLITMNISKDATVNSLLYAMENNSQTPFQIWECQNKLKSYTASNQYISQAYISVLANHNIISTTYYYKDITSKALTVNGSSNVLLSPLFEYSSGKLTKAGISDDKINEDETLIYTKTFPNGVINSAYGNICLVFNQAQLRNLLTFTNEWTGGYNLILDKSNQIVVCSSTMPNGFQNSLLSLDKDYDSFEAIIDGSEMYVTYIDSPEAGLKYVSVYPQKQVLSRALHIKNLLIIFIVLSGIIGLGISLLFSLSHTKPVKQIISTLSGAGELNSENAQDDYSFIQQSLNKLILQNHTLAEHSQNQNQFVNNAVFHMLLNGEKVNSDLLKSITKKTGVNLSECGFIAIQFGFDSVSDENTSISAMSRHQIIEYIKNIISLSFSGDGVGYYFSEEDSTALICFPLNERLEIYTTVNQVIKEAESAVTILDKHSENHHLFIGISNTHTGADEAFRCGDEARFSAEYSKLFEFGKPVFYDMVGESISLYKFTLSDHQYLLNVLKSGDTANAQQAFNDLINRNIVENRMNESMIEQLFYAIKGILLEGADFAGEPAIKKEINSARFQETDFFSSFLSLENSYIEIAAKINDKRSQKSHVLAANICDYLAAEFSDANITLTSAADKFNISETHLSKLFREYVKTSFASYLEKLRITKAKELLIVGQLKMIEIAEQTGYNSVESFRRAFKRISGVAPSEYKELIERTEKDNEL